MLYEVSELVIKFWLRNVRTDLLEDQGIHEWIKLMRCQ
jgi:hypothetical protein